jgi:tetratricopeptide (TPR) repeat protein
LRRGVERSTILADRGAEAELALRIGHLLRLVSDFVSAQQWLERSLRCFEQLDGGAGVARALNQLAYVDCLLNRDERAVQRATAALALLGEDDYERAMSRFVLGMVAANRWQWVEAETHHRAALDLRQRQGDVRRTGWALQNVGYALQGQQRYTEAIEYFRAAEVTRPIGRSCC